MNHFAVAGFYLVLSLFLLGLAIANAWRYSMMTSHERGFEAGTKHEYERMKILRDLTSQYYSPECGCQLRLCANPAHFPAGPPAWMEKRDPVQTNQQAMDFGRFEG